VELTKFEVNAITGAIRGTSRVGGVKDVRMIDGTIKAIQDIKFEDDAEEPKIRKLKDKDDKHTDEEKKAFGEEQEKWGDEMKRIYNTPIPVELTQEQKLLIRARVQAYKAWKLDIDEVREKLIVLFDKLKIKD